MSNGSDLRVAGGTPALTVIMSCYNQAQYLRQAVESVLMQKTDFPVRLIITDDHSTKDESVALISDYAARHPDRITALLNETNGRYLANVLRAKALTKTEYFTLLDADDFWTDERYLQQAVDCLEANPDHTVYFRNVKCLYADGREAAFMPEGAKDKTYQFEDLVKERILVPQTTGAVFRNVIFREGVPDIMKSAIGTVHERSFEGDVFRFLMHLKCGKARFENRTSGVYRIAESGIWSQMPEAERRIVQARCSLDFFRYFGVNEGFFVRRALKDLTNSLQALERDVRVGKAVSEKYWAYLRSVCEECAACPVGDEAREKPSGLSGVSLKDRLKLAVYWRFKQGLDEKGLI